MSQWFPDAAAPTDLEVFLFDLNGFIIVRGALSPAELAAGNSVMDGLQRLKRGDWAGHVHAHSYGGKEGLNQQQIYEGGLVWERLLDHPAYIEKVRTFVGGEDGFDYLHGPSSSTNASPTSAPKARRSASTAAARTAAPAPSTGYRTAGSTPSRSTC